MARFSKTIDIWQLDTTQRRALQPGQWVTAGADGPLGRFYGERRGGTVVAWQGNAKGSRNYREYQKTIHTYAKSTGA